MVNRHYNVESRPKVPDLGSVEAATFEATHQFRPDVTETKTPVGKYLLLNFQAYKYSEGFERRQGERFDDKELYEQLQNRQSPFLDNTCGSLKDCKKPTKSDGA